MKKRILSAFLVVVSLFVLAASAATVSAAGTGDFAYSTSGSGVVITGYTGTETKLTIPEYIDGKPVVGIGANAFYGKNLKSVSIPATCKSIGDSAFAQCMSLETVVLASGVETIGNSAFEKCYNLTSINLPKSVTSIGLNAFALDSKLTIECYDGTYGATYAGASGYSYTASPVYGVAAAITRKPSKLVFYEGEELVTDGLVLEIQYNDGTTSSYTRGFTVTGYDPDKVGTQIVYVRYEDVSASYAVTVAANNATALEIKKLPAKQIYLQGEELDLTGIEVEATYESGDTRTVKDGFEATYDFSELGTKTVTLTYRGQTVSYDVTVIHNAKEVKVTSAPKKTIYTVGDEFDPTGLVVTATLVDGTVMTVEGSKLQCEYDFSEAGTKTVIIYFGGKTATVDVTVKAPATIRYIGLDEEFMPKTVYKVGEKFNPVGMYIYVKYSDGTASLVSWRNVEYYINGRNAANYVFEKTGTYRVSYGYAGQGDNDLIVYVSEDGTMPVSSISILTLPTKTTYAPGEQLSTEGLQIFVTYADGTSATIDSGFSATADLTAAGTQVVTVGYKGVTTTFEVTVATVTVSSIAVTKAPSKTTYKVGESFSAAGLEVTATYSDGSKKVVTGYTLSVVDTSAAGTKIITVNFEGKTATFTIKVEKAADTQTSETETQATESQTQATESQTQATESQTQATETKAPDTQSESKSTESSATESSTGDSGTTKKSSLWWIFLIIAIVLVIILIVLYLFVFKKNGDDEETETTEEETEETEEEETSEETTEETPAEETSEETSEETAEEPKEEAAEEAPAEEATEEEAPAEETAEEPKEEAAEEAPAEETAEETTEETTEDTPAEETAEETAEEESEDDKKKE
ncbi:MAG: bacterial Ig-like domain-containing protein [Clostridia bacterium]|nr:bacterial Ig-like domain-containing protein [Clostridia bacterium]